MYGYTLSLLDALAIWRRKVDGGLGQHVDKLHLYDLRCRQRAPELLAVQRILARGLIAGLRRAHASPGDAVASTIEAAEGPFQARDIEHVLLRNLAEIGRAHV